MPSVNIPKKINFVNSKPLTEQQANYIRVWAKTHPDYIINVWRDREAVNSQYLFREMFNYVAQREFGHPQSSPVGLTLKDFAEKVKLEYKSLSANPLRRAGTGTDGLNDSAIRVLLKTRSIDIGDNFKNILKEQESIYSDLKSVTNIKIQDISIDQNKFNPELFKGDRSIGKTYHDFHYGNAYPLSELIIGLDALKKGGFYINSGVLPEFNFEPLSEAQKKKMPEEIQLLFKKAALELVLKREKELGNVQNDIGDSNILKVEETNYNSDYLALKEKINNLNPENFFKKLGTRQLKYKDSIILESIESSSSTPTSTKVAILGAAQGSDLLPGIHSYHLQAVEEYQNSFKENKFYYQIFDFELNKLHDLKLLNRNIFSGLLDEDSLSDSEDDSIQDAPKKPDPVKVKWAVKAYYSLDLLNVAPELNRYGDVFGDSVIRKYYDGANLGEPERLFSQNHVYPPSDQTLVARVEPPARYVRGQNYDSQIIISLDDDPWIYTESYVEYSNVPINKSNLFQYNIESNELLLVHGKKFKPDDKTRIILVGHGSNDGFERPIMPKLVSLFRKLMPEGAKVKRIALRGCSLADKSHRGLKTGVIPANSDIFVAKLLRRLKGIDILTHDLTASQVPIDTNLLGNRIFFTDENRPDRIEVVSRKRKDTRYVYSLNDDNSVSYTVKESLPPDIQTRPELFDQNELTSIFGQKSIISHETSSDITSHNILMNSDIKNAIQIGTLESLNKRSTIVIAEPDKTKYNQIIEVLSSTHDFKKYSEWESWIRKTHPDLLSSVEDTMVAIPDSQSVYSRFRNKVAEGAFSFIKLDPTSLEDASVIKQRYPDGFARIYLPDVPAHELCRPRRSLTGESCRLNFDEEKSSLKLLSDDQTSIVVSGEGKKDILLLDPSGKPTLLAFQQAVRELKTELADSKVNNRHNYHNFIALDAESMLQAKRLVTQSDKPGKALQLNPQRRVLLDSSNAVFLKVEGGAGNSLTLLGSPDSFKSRDLARTVTDFIANERVGRLTIGVVKNGMSLQSVTTEFSAINLSALQALTDGSMQLQMIDPQHTVTPSDPIRIASLADDMIISNRYGVVENPSMGIDTRSMPLSTLKSTRTSLLAMEKQIFSQPIVRSSANSMVIRFHIESAAAGLSRTLSKNSLSTDLIPRLDSLEQKGKKWKLKFYSVNDKTSRISTKRLDISDPDLLASLKFINEKISLSRQSLQEVTKNPIGTMDAIGDGVGVAMTLGSLVYQMFRNEALQSDQTAPRAGSDFQRRILEAQIIYGMINEHIATVDALLTMGKYVSAIKKGKSVVSLGERMATFIDKHYRASASAASSGKAVSTLGSRAMRLSGPVINLAISAGMVTLDIMALSACETKRCRENAGIILGLDLAQTVPVLISLGASAATTVGLISSTSAAAVGSAMGVAALPITFTVTIITIGLHFKEEMRQKFENNMAFWQMVYDDLTLKGAWDGEAKKWNLLTTDITVKEGTGQYERVYKRSEKPCMGRSFCSNTGTYIDVEILKDVVKQRLFLTPIKAIDFSQKQVEFGEINIHKIKSPSGSVYLNGDASGEAYRRRVSFYGCKGEDGLFIKSATFNLLAHPAVSRFIQNNFEWPEENIETVILPSGKNWNLKRWWGSSVPVSDATSWGFGRSDGKGWELLMQASRDGLTNNVNKDFTFTFYPRKKGDGPGGGDVSGASCEYEHGNTQEASAFILKDLSDRNIINFSETQHINITAGHYNQTFITPDDPAMSYSFYGQGGNFYTVSLTHFSKADFHQTGNEQWTIDDRRHSYTIKDFLPFIASDEKPEGGLITLQGKRKHTTDSECVMQFKGFNASSSNPYPVVVVDKYRYPHYILDAKAGRFKVYYPEVKDAFQLSYRSRTDLWWAYKRPLPDAYALNKPRRFHELSSHRWLDVEPEKLTYISFTGRYTDTLVRGELIPVEGGTEGIALPTDITPMAGTPSQGYLFFSHSQKKLYYRQPLDQTNGHMTEIPAQFTSSVGSGSDRFQFSLQSSQRVTYHLEKIRKPDGESRSVPVIEPSRAIWVNANYVDSANEMKQFSQGLPTSAHIIKRLSDNESISKGFFDARANSGNGRVIIWNPFAAKKAFFIDNAVNQRSSDSMNDKLYSAFYTRRPGMDGKTLELINVKRDTQGDRYLFFQKSQLASAFYVVDTGSLSSSHNNQPIHKLQATEFSTTAMFNHQRRRIINAALSPFGSEILFTLSDSVIFGVNQSVLDPLLGSTGQRYPSVNLGGSGHDLWVRGVNYSQGDIKTTINDLIQQILTPYINQSERPVMKVPPIVPVHGYVPKKHAKNPHDISSWYIVEPGFVYATKSTISLIGFDAPSNTLYAFDIDTKEVLSAKCKITDEYKNCEKLAAYSPYRYDYKNIYLKDGAVYGLDYSDNIYQQEKHRRVLLTMDINKGLQSFDLQQATGASLKAKVNGIVKAQLSEIIREEGTELPEELTLSHAQNIPGYQLWYHTAASKVAPEGLYVFKNPQKVAFLGSTPTQGNRVDWFYSTSSRLLFKRENSTLQTLGPYDGITSENGSNSLAISGRPDNDRFPDIRLGQPLADSTLHLNGGGGSDNYPVSGAMIRHYQSIIIDNRVREKAHDFAPASSESVVTTELWANEFSASIGSEALQLFHHPTGHSLFFPAHHPMSVRDSQNNPYTFPAGKLLLTFTGLNISLNQLLKQTLRQPDASWQLPIDITRVSPKTPLTASQGLPLKLSVPDRYYLKDFRESNTIDGWHLKFRSGEKTKNINILDKDKLAAKAGNFWITRGHDNIPIYMPGGITSKIKQNLPFLRTTLKSIKDQQYEMNPISENGLVYRFISTEQLRKPVEPKSPGTDKNDSEWLIFHQRSYEGLEAKYTGVTSNAPGSQVYKPVIRIADESGKQKTALTSMPAAVFFAWNPVLKGWPLKTTDQFALGHSDPTWLVTTENTFIKEFTPEGHNAVPQLPDPVLYNLKAEQLSVMKHGSRGHWHILNQKDLIHKVKGRRSADSLSLTLAEKVGGNVTGSSRYLAMPYTFDQWVLRSTHSTASGFPFYLGPEKGIGVGLSPLSAKGFIPEKQMADLLMAKSLGMYDGVYFEDGLKATSAIRNHLSQQPLTRVARQQEANSDTSFSGNALNNVIHVTVSYRTSRITVNGKAGDDFIQIARDEAKNWQYKTRSGLNRNIHSFLKNQRISINAGPGDDILHLPDQLRVKVEDSPGEDTVCISRFSRVDMLAMKQWTLFIRELSADQIEPVLVTKTGNKYQPVTSPSQATEVFLREVGKPDQLFARVNINGKGSIHFPDGSSVRDFQSWLGAYTPPAATIQPTQTVTSMVAPTASVGGSRYSGPANATEPLPATPASRGLESVREKLKSLIVYRQSSEAMKGEALFQQQLNRLVQDMGVFAAGAEAGENTATLATATITPSPSLVSPQVTSMGT
ncbi:C80 family cysteine peptidase [Endozoicomonas euniceicola]|uniref:C80 family cysteine peptidase n=1 Tax=Endozoicomonas euniceicola TaxID=1234143 RepID=A0ABY6GP50_9GAMM|nr:C80 family cysteine peptidase [Endozoicomonas euniceicola]UYM14527.1 C80 family cysteine peptidase [Endozoicomonas euniceicola]